jgi:hypothetical protein
MEEILALLEDKNCDLAKIQAALSEQKSDCVKRLEVVTEEYKKLKAADA